MKIAMVSTRDVPVWENDHVAGMAGALRALRHNVTVHLRQATEPEETESSLGGFVDSLRDRWSRDRPDLVHAHSWKAGLAAVLAAQRLGLPVVQTFHGLGPDRDQVNVERLIGREAALIVASCEQEVLDLAAAGIPRPRTVVVPRGVDTGLFQPRGDIARRRFPRRVVAMADSSPDSGVADLVAALPWLEDVELVVTEAREPREAERVRGWARRLGVEDRTRVLGPNARRNLPALLRSADIAAFVPRRALWDDAPLKAMACGVPVVATAVGGLPDAVVDGVTGVLVPSQDRKQLVRKLRTVLKYDVFRHSCGIAATDRIQARHTWTVVGKCVERLYAGLLERRAGDAVG